MTYSWVVAVVVMVTEEVVVPVTFSACDDTLNKITARERPGMASANNHPGFSNFKKIEHE